MSDIIENLTWDSEFFGFPIGQFETHQLKDEDQLRLALTWARDRGLRCLYFQAHPDDGATVTLVEKHGFHLVDVRLVLARALPARLEAPDTDKIRITPPKEAEIERLAEIAAQISHVSRFAFDQNFGLAQAEALYRLWIQKAMAGYADAVWVARQPLHDEAMGFVTGTLRDKTASLQLIGVHSNYQGQGVGKALVDAALYWAQTQGASHMQVITQARNVPAQQLYQKKGFLTISVMLYYHKWFDNPAAD